MRKYFTPEEEAYIEEYFGIKSAEAIGRKLGIPSKSVINKAYKMGLTSLIDCSGKITANMLATLVGYDFKVIKKWISNHGLPHVRRSLNHNATRKHILIDPKQFWVWAEKNKERIDFLRIERNVIVPEPEWVEVERNKLKKNPIKPRKIWTAQEELQVWDMYYGRGMLQKDIAKKFDVTTVAIEKKLKQLRDKGGQSYISSVSA